MTSPPISDLEDCWYAALVAQERDLAYKILGHQHSKHD